jgi:hypothetical protein
VTKTKLQVQGNSHDEEGKKDRWTQVVLADIFVIFIHSTQFFIAIEINELGDRAAVLEVFTSK